MMNARTLPVLLALLLWLCLPAAPVAARDEPVIAPPFRATYWQNQGMRTLGLVQSPLLDVQGYPAQYFEKGRLEDHRQETDDPTWRVAYGRLTAELMEQAPRLPVNNTDVAYGELARYGAEQQPPPAGFTGGTLPLADGVFVPAHPQLQPAPGYVVPTFFWEYINRADLFPSGWLYTLGLPLTRAFEAELIDPQGTRQTITMQAFERTVLTYNPQNPPAWQVERGNIGTDALQATGRIPLLREPTPPRYVFPVQDADCDYGRYHHDYPATDIFCPVGSTFVATTAGVVDFVRDVDRWNPATDDPDQRGGLAVAIVGDDGLRYYGSHLATVAEGITPGVRVAAGQVLGQVGRSGNARNTPPHLHYGISRPTTPDDWQVRRGEIPPYDYLQTWARGEMVTPQFR
jgi:hypothetical protein